jgi:hypothetical protein
MPGLTFSDPPLGHPPNSSLSVTSMGMMYELVSYFALYLK